MGCIPYRGRHGYRSIAVTARKWANRREAALSTLKALSSVKAFTCWRCTTFPNKCHQPETKCSNTLFLYPKHFLFKPQVFASTLFENANVTPVGHVLLRHWMTGECKPACRDRRNCGHHLFSLIFSASTNPPAPRTLKVQRTYSKDLRGDTRELQAFEFKSSASKALLIFYY